MGGGFDAKTRMIDCTGQLVTKELDHVFQDPKNPRFQHAQRHNNFDRVLPNAQGNWKDLIIAYVVAGVDVKVEWPAWCEYLEQLGTKDPQNIYKIAQARLTALNTTAGMNTITHRGGGPVITTATTIDSPCPP
jgi:hypothetical protein